MMKRVSGVIGSPPQSDAALHTRSAISSCPLQQNVIILRLFTALRHEEDQC